MDHPDNPPCIFSDAYLFERFFIKSRVAVHVFPGGLKEVAVSIADLIVFDKEIAGRYKVLGYIIFPKRYTHLVMFQY
jgi:hypothetical protein